jgi:hypothetical protein
MRNTILTKHKVEHLFNHILDGFKSSAEGLKFLRRDGIIQDPEYLQLLEKNAERLIERINEFKITHKLMSIFFAGLFIWLQVGNDDLEMRRARRTRSRRRNETEQTLSG